MDWFPGARIAKSDSLHGELVFLYRGVSVDLLLTKIE